MPRLKVLLTVTTYPLPSRKYDDLVCTAGVLEDGNWIRIYPIPLNFLQNLKRDGVLQPTKYSWITLDLKRRRDDFRPESHSPVDYEFKDLVVGEHIGTDNATWRRRKELCLKNVYTNRTQLIAESKKPSFKSLATFKPSEFMEFIVEKTDEDWDPVYKELKKQGSLFDPNPEKGGEVVSVKKLPYKFYYRFKDDEGKISKLMIEDWEIGQLYWNCLRRANNDEQLALQKVREKYETLFFQEKDLYLFLGTTKRHHNTSKNPFVIVGVFYPKREWQTSLF